MSIIIWQILLQIFLIILNAIFACAEIAVISVNPAKLNKLAEKKNRNAKRLLKMTKEPSGFLATIQVAITLSGFLASAFAADNFAEPIVAALIAAGSPVAPATLHTLMVILITFILSFFTLVFGELVPKRLAMRKSEKLALILATPVYFLSKLFFPLVWTLTKSTNLILRLFGIDPNKEEDSVSEEEIQLLVDMGNEKGIICHREKEMIQNVFAFNDTIAESFATHRKDIDFLWVEDDFSEWEKTIHETRHTYYPICKENIDNIIGVLNIKDLFRSSSREKEYILSHLAKKPFLIPSSLKADQIFTKMKEFHHPVAFLLDEYGGTAGMITLNDILEQIMGDFDDEIDDDYELSKTESRSIKEIAPQKWEIIGNYTLTEVEQALAIKINHEGYDTYSGYLLGLHGDIPNDGVQFTIKTPIFTIEVLELNNHRINHSILTLSSTEQVTETTTSL